MFRPLLSLLYLLLASLACGQPPLTITSSGYFLTVVDDAGVPSLVKITQVIDLLAGIDLPPDEPDEPQPPEFDLLAVASVREWSAAVSSPQTAQAIAAVYSHVRGAVEDDIVATGDTWSVLKSATDAAIGIAAEGRDWKPFRDKLGALITERRQRGTLATRADIVRLLHSVQQGLELSADGSIALSMDKLVRTAKSTNEIIDGYR